MQTKKCPSCKKDKLIIDYRKNKNKKDGLSYNCKDCHSKYRKKKYQENKDKELKQVRKYQENYERKTNKKYNDQYRVTSKTYCKKAGRTYSTKCPNCSVEVFLTKKETETGFIRFCSNACRSSKNKSIYDRHLTIIKRRDKKINGECDLDATFLKFLLEEKQNNRCALSNVPIILKDPNTPSILYESASLDRKNNKIGYTKENVQWVVVGINYMKLDYEETEAIKLIQLIVEHKRVSF